MHPGGHPFLPTSTVAGNQSRDGDCFTTELGYFSFNGLTYEITVVIWYKVRFAPGLSGHIFILASNCVLN